MNSCSVFQMAIDVTENDIDIMGHVNNVAYVGWMQDAAIAHSDNNGWNWRRYQDIGAAFIAKMHQIEYVSSAFDGDRILIETWVSEMRKVSSMRSYRFVNDKSKKLLATASTKWAFVRLSDSKPIRIPDQVIASFSVAHPDFDDSTS